MTLDLYLVACDVIALLGSRAWLWAIERAAEVGE